MNARKSRGRRALHALLPSTTALLALATPVLAQDLDDYEYEPGEGLHHQEWYDPGDWFDLENGIDYEGDGWDHDVHPTEDQYGELEYGYHREWNPEENRWRTDYGFYSDESHGTYDLDPYDYAYDPYLGVHGYAPYDDWYWDAGMGLWRMDDQDSSGSKNKDDSASENGESRSKHRGEVRVAGQLDGFQKVELEGQRDAHALIRIRMEDGRKKVVDLGPRVSPSDLGMRSGDHLVLRGNMGRIDDQAVLMATHVSVAGDATSIPSFRTRKSGPQERTVRGTLASLEEVPSKAVKGHTLVRMGFEDEPSRLVCIGPGRSLDDLHLERGRKVVLRGFDDRVEGQPVLLLESVKAGETREALHPMDWKGHDPSAREASSKKPPVVMRGIVADAKTVQIDGSGADHHLIQLELKSGDTAIVDLGTQRSLDDLDMSEGDSIAVRGREDEIDGKPLFRATQIRLEGEKTSIPRSGKDSASRGDASEEYGSAAVSSRQL